MCVDFGMAWLCVRGRNPLMCVCVCAYTCDDIPRHDRVFGKLLTDTTHVINEVLGVSFTMCVCRLCAYMCCVYIWFVWVCVLCVCICCVRICVHVLCVHCVVYCVCIRVVCAYVVCVMRSMCVCCVLMCDYVRDTHTFKTYCTYNLSYQYVCVMCV